MDWHFKWVSSNDSDFNRDYHVSFTKDDIEQGNTMYNYEAGGKTHDGEAPGISVFYKDERGDVFHIYSSYARGGDLLIGTYNYLDLMPKGRNEESDLKGWVRRRLIGTIRRERLDWLIPTWESHLRCMLKEWGSHYNRGGPHMSLGPGVPDPPAKKECFDRPNPQHL
jgi:hypothetical protein